MVVKLASGILAGPGNHNDVKHVSEIAVKTAYALQEEIKKATIVEKARVESEKAQVEINRNAIEDKHAADLKVVEDKANAEKARIDAEHKAAKEAAKVEAAADKAEMDEQRKGERIH